MMRKKPYMVNEQGVSKWENPEELDAFLRTTFAEQEDYNEANWEALYDAYILEHFYVGKPCPYCNTTVLWKLTETPGINPTTGRMTFYAPMKRVQQAFPDL